MTRDVFDIDRLFREIEQYIEDSINSYGGHGYDGYHSYDSYYDDYIEDDDRMYLTIDIGTDLESMLATIENDNELVVMLDDVTSRLTLPKDADKVERITCVNGLLDIIIRKKKNGKRKAKDD